MSEYLQGLANQQAYGVYQQPALQIANVGTIWGGSSYVLTTAGTSNMYYQPVVIEEKPKKKKRIIVELREEMRNWHGELV